MKHYLIGLSAICISLTLSNSYAQEAVSGISNLSEAVLSNKIQALETDILETQNEINNILNNNIDTTALDNRLDALETGIIDTQNTATAIDIRVNALENSTSNTTLVNRVNSLWADKPLVDAAVSDVTGIKFCAIANKAHAPNDPAADNNGCIDGRPPEFPNLDIVRESNHACNRDAEGASSEVSVGCPTGYNIVSCMGTPGELGSNKESWSVTNSFVECKIKTTSANCQDSSSTTRRTNITAVCLKMN